MNVVNKFLSKFICKLAYFGRKARFLLVSILYLNLRHGYWSEKYDNQLSFLFREYQKSCSISHPYFYQKFIDLLAKFSTDPAYFPYIGSSEKASIDFLLKYKSKSSTSIYKLYEHISILSSIVNSSIGVFNGLLLELYKLSNEVRYEIFSFSSVFPPASSGHLVVNQINGFGLTFGHQALLAFYLKCFANQLLHQSELVLLIASADSPNIANSVYQQLIIDYAKNIPKCTVIESSVDPLTHDSNLMQLLQIDSWKLTDGNYHFNDAINKLQLNDPSPVFQLNFSSLKSGEDMITAVGLNASLPFVVLQIRNGIYGASNGLARNSNIYNYAESVLYLSSLGYNIFILSNEKITYFDDSANTNVVCLESSSQHRNELFDLYLLSNCQFYISNLSGPTEVAASFSSPTLLTNAPNISSDSSVFRPFSFLIPKLLFDKKNCTLLDFTSMFAIPASYQAEISQSDFEYIENTASDILLGVKDMLSIFGRYQNYKHRYQQAIDNPLSIRFQNLRRKAGINLNLPLTPSFLMSYSHLLI